MHRNHVSGLPVVGAGRRLEAIVTRSDLLRVVLGRTLTEVADEGDAPDINLIAHAKGISPAASRGDATAEQQAVLDVMPNAARTAVTTS